MPTYTRIFALNTTSVANAFASNVVFNASMYEFDLVQDMDLPPNGLLVIKPENALWTEMADGWRNDNNASTSFLDASDCIPIGVPNKTLYFIKGIAQKLTTAVSFYHRFERGDYLYFEVGWAFDYRSTTPTHYQGDYLYLRDEMFDLDVQYHHTTILFRDDGPKSGVILDGYVFQHILKHLGVVSPIAYFPPDEMVGFDWDKYHL